MKTDLHVDPEHFAYLRIQKGSLDKFAENFPTWLERYRADIRETFEQMKPHLPHVCGSMLDVGGGLGGIDAILWRHYEEQGQLPDVAILDGLNDPPVMEVHGRTFSNAYMARNFLVKNGVFPLALDFYGPDVAQFRQRFDLVCSFGSWCFHYPPTVYLPQLVTSGIHAGTRFVIDVRNGKSAWLAELLLALEVVQVIARRPKWQRFVFRVRGDLADRLQRPLP